MNTQSPARISLVLLFSLVASAFLYRSAAAEKYHWVDMPGKYMTLQHGDVPVLRYIYRAYDDSTEQNKFETYKVFCHLYDPSGKVLLTNGPTVDKPYSKDVLYPHHRGLFYGFNQIRYGKGKKADTWHCHHGESQQHVKVLSESNDASNRRVVAIEWHGQDGKVFIKEKRTLQATCLPGGTMVDFVSTLESATGGVVHLAGDPQHAGFQFRATNQVAQKTKGQTYYLRTDGKGKPGDYRNWDHRNLKALQNKECENRPWNAMSFVVDGKRYTALYLDHPDNPKPAHYSERDYGRFGSAFAADVSPEKPLTVRYRLWLQEGEMAVEECNKLSKEFTAKRSTHTITQQAKDNTPPEGFVALFNGKDLTGWKGLVGNPKSRAKMSPEKLAAAQKQANERMRKHWKVEDGALVFDGKGKSLCTAKDYGNFEMFVDWKILKAGDSGIYLRGSPQVQIWDTEHKPIAKHGANKGSGALWNNQKHTRFPLVKADHPVGEWNTFYIKMIGNRVTVKLNGKLVTDNVVMENYWERDKPIYPTGQIELQNHGNTLWFKNIYIKELPASEGSKNKVSKKVKQ